jgi:DedD protein
MDAQLKARLIGAAVLVAIAVLLIPELLSGRKAATALPADEGAGRGTRTYTIDLGTGATSAADAGGVVPQPTPQTMPQPAPLHSAPPPEPGNRTVAEPQAATKQLPVTAELPKPVAQPAVVATEPAPRPVKPLVAPARSGWTVQVGAFGTPATARKMVNDLVAAGYDAYVSPISKGGKTLHRVRVGRVAARPEAEQLAAKLAGRRLPATVVVNE